MRIFGIDPGLSGAIAVLENEAVIDIIDLPVMSEGKKNKRQLNSAQLSQYMSKNVENIKCSDPSGGPASL